MNRIIASQRASARAKALAQIVLDINHAPDAAAHVVGETGADVATGVGMEEVAADAEGVGEEPEHAHADLVLFLHVGI